MVTGVVAETVDSSKAADSTHTKVLRSRAERMNAKIRDAQLQKVPYMLVVGDREAEAHAAAVRLRSGEDLKALPIADIVTRMANEVAQKVIA